MPTTPELETLLHLARAAGVDPAEAGRVAGIAGAELTARFIKAGAPLHLALKDQS